MALRRLTGIDCLAAEVPRYSPTDPAFGGA